MRQILSRSLLTVAAASSVLAATGGYANADSGAEGNATGSPGILSGDSVQAPVNVPVNVCGNSVNAVAAANPAFGNHCANESQHSAGAHDSGRSHAGSGASGRSVAKDSPGVLAGDSLDVPVHAPVNLCGNTVDPFALLDAVFGNSCENGSASSVSRPRPPAEPQSPPETDSKPPTVRHEPPVTHSVTHEVLAETGFSGGELGGVGALGAALLLGGAILYRRAPRAGAAVR